MNGLPFIQTAENIFYLESGPAYQDHAIGLAATTNKNDTNQQRSVPARIGINRSFIVPGGIVRILLILFLAAGWISALCIVKFGNVFFDKKSDLNDFSTTRTAYLIITFLGFFTSIGIFLLNFFNITNLRIFRKIPWLVMFVFVDLIFMGLTFSIAVAACVREKQLTDASNSASIFEFAINKGGFAAAGFFGLFSSFFYLICIVIFELEMFKEKNSVSPTSSDRMQSRPSFGRATSQNKDDSIKQQTTSVSESSPASVV